MKSLVSVIVPLYNAAPYIEECLQSVIDSTYEPIEVVVVDDGSTDESLRVAQAFAKQHPAVKVLHQANEIERLRNEKDLLAEKISKNYLGDLLKAVNQMKQGLQEKKHKMEQIDSGLAQIQATLEKMEQPNE